MSDDYQGFAATGWGAGISDDYEGFSPACEEDWI